MEGTVDHEGVTQENVTTGNEQVQRLIQRLGDFIAFYEVAEEKLTQREQASRESMQRHEEYVGEKLTVISKVLSDFEHVMTEVGVARWRVAAEEALREGEQHVQKLAAINEEFAQLANQTCDRLEQAAGYVVKSISESVGAFHATDFKQLAESSCHEVEKTANLAVKQIASVSRWFYWRKALLVFFCSVMVAVVTGMYINGEWPWEDHRDVMQQREVGKAAMHEWQQLSKQDQQRILTYLRQKQG